MRRLLSALLLLASPALAGAAVTYVGQGSFTASQAACTVSTTGASWVAGDILLVATESENQTISLTTANSFAEVGAQASQSAGTAGVDPASRLAVWWKRATSSSDTMPVIADSGDHNTCQLFVFRGAYATGNPWDVLASGNDSGANDTTGVIPGATTTVADTFFALFISSSNNGNSTAQCSAWTNANLTNLTERADNTSTQGLGGGFCLATGDRAATGTVGNTTVTMAQTTYKGALAIAFKPEPPPAIVPVIIIVN